MQLLQTPLAVHSASPAGGSLASTYPNTPASPDSMSNTSISSVAPAAYSKTTRIYAGKLFDSEAQTLLPNRLITIAADSGLILSVEPYAPGDVPSDQNEAVIDLSNATVLPGLVDAHVHCGYQEIHDLSLLSLAARVLESRSHTHLAYSLLALVLGDFLG